MDIRLGNGFDVHAFCEGDHVWLCGVKIPHSRRAFGPFRCRCRHACADRCALWRYWPWAISASISRPSDPQWKGAASHIFLAHAMKLARDRGFALGNADVTLICERPKIGPHATAMRKALAEIMEVDDGPSFRQSNHQRKTGLHRPRRRHRRLGHSNIGETMTPSRIVSIFFGAGLLRPAPGTWGSAAAIGRRLAPAPYRAFSSAGRRNSSGHARMGFGPAAPNWPANRVRTRQKS